MPFATEFFDSGNTTIVMTKDYSNCEGTYFIIFDDDRLVHADSRQWSTMLPTLWIREMVPQCRSLPQPRHSLTATMKGTFEEFNYDMFSHSDRCI